jgi:hypothetical protein
VALGLHGVGGLFIACERGGDVAGEPVGANVVQRQQLAAEGDEGHGLRGGGGVGLLVVALGIGGTDLHDAEAVHVEQRQDHQLDEHQRAWGKKWKKRKGGNR